MRFRKSLEGRGRIELPMIRSAVERLTVLATGPENFGGGPEIRTLQYRVWNPVLSQSSLSPVVRLLGFEPAGFEPAPVPILSRVPSVAQRAPRLQAHGTRGEIRTHHCSVSKTDASCQLGYSGIFWIVKDLAGLNCIRALLHPRCCDPRQVRTCCFKPAQPTFRGFYRDQ